jgi:hypothetical protein
MTTRKGGEYTMSRYLWLLLLPAVLLLAPTPTNAQWLPPGPAPGWRPQMAGGLAGTYLSQGGAPCFVEGRRDSYVFINDQGSRARFVFTGPNQLEQIGPTGWDPTVVCTVTRDRFGLTVLRFDSPNAPPGYWTSAD